MDAEARESLAYLRLKLRAGRSLLRDLAQAVNEVEKQLDRIENAEPKEAERESEIGIYLPEGWRDKLTA